MAGGRKLEFDKAQALEAAMQVFWKKGYLGASLTDLTEGMGINKPSLYATFGNKEALFVQATAHYLETHANPKLEYLYANDKPLRDRLRQYLLAILSGQCDKKNPKGCYISLCIAETAGEEMPAEAQVTITTAATQALQTLTDFFQTDAEAKAQGLAKKAREKALFLVSIMHGTAALSRAGQSQKELTAVIDQALTGLEIE